MSCPWRSAPAGDVENHPMARCVVLNTHVEVISRLVEEPAGPLRGQIVERTDPDAAIRQTVVIVAIVETVPEIVVAADFRTIAVLVNDPVPAARLMREVVHHCELRRADDEILDLGDRRVRRGL